MNTSAIILMVMTQVTVILIAGFFFFKVLTIPPKPEPDSFDENDEVPR